MNSRRLYWTAALVLFSAASAYASGGSPCDDRNCTSFFSSEIIHSPGEEPIFRTWNNGYRRVFVPSEIPDINAEEWAKYFRGKVDLSKIAYLVYSMTTDELRSLISGIEDKKVTLSGLNEELRIDLAKSGNRTSQLSALRYLLLAKQVEPLATKNNWNPWSYPPQPKPVVNVDVKALIDEAERQIPKSDAFIAARYRFQILRLLFYSEQYALATDYYEKVTRTFSAENSVKYRAMELAAGAYARQKKFGKADYLYSVVFDRFAPLKGSSYQSFHPMEDADWKETLALAKTPREKEALWQLLGIYADSGAAIDSIYAMNPSSQLLPLLLMREVNTAEQSWTGNQTLIRFSAINDRYAQKPRPDLDVIGKKRLDRIRAIADAENTYKPYLWLLSAGHLFALAGDNANAELYLSRASKAMPDEPDLRAQLRMSTLLQKVRSLKGIDKSMEPFLAKELDWLNGSTGDPATNMNDWIRRYLGAIYSDGGDPLRGVMLTNDIESDVYQTPGKLDRMLELMRAPTGDFDRFLLRNYNHSEGNIQELRALTRFYSGDFANAIETLKLTGNAGEQVLSADPFAAQISDCIYCAASVPHTTYTKISFAQKMLALSQAAQGRDESAAEASFLLANGFYNMSYYGNSRDIYRTEHLDLMISSTTEDRHRINLNMDLAEVYYLQAAALSRNREFKAKALFMAAKTEQNRSYNSPSKTNAHMFFKRLKDDFSDTQYYREIIQECQHFARYVR